MFHDGDLQSGIALAVQQAKAVLCFVHNETETSRQWEEALVEDDDLRGKIAANTVALRLQGGSQEATFLSSFTPLGDVPAVIVIRNGTVQLHAHAKQAGGGHLTQRLSLLFGNDASSANLLANTINAATPERPFSPMPGSTSAASHPAPPVPSPHHAPEHTPEIWARPITQRPGESRLPPVGEVDNDQTSQRIDYVKIQKEREQKQRDERERIKQQIKADREERRRQEQVRKQGEAAVVASEQASAMPKPKSSDIRVQVRTFDGSTLRQTFNQSSSISKDIRPWVDENSEQTTPYNLKLILTPLPNRSIEASEEERPLTDLGIKGSCTLVMVPVVGYVESYTGVSAGGLVGSAVNGGYNLVSGTANALFGGVRSLIYGQPNQEEPQATPSTDSASDGNAAASRNVRVRTLADQRAEAAQKDQQFYNGNQLNFEPRAKKEEEKED